MLSFSALWPAIGASGAFVMALIGYRMMRGNPSDYLDAEDILLLREQRRRERARGATPLGRLAAKLTPQLRRLIGRRGVEYLQRQIANAGSPADMSVDGLLKSVALWVLIMLPLAILFLARGMIVVAAMLPLLVVFMPLMPLLRRARIRRESIDNDLPDFLDILSVTVSAGIGFRAALSRVADRFRGPLAEEIRLTLDQLGHGAPLRVAFNGLQERTGSVAVRSFVTAFLQSEELGAPLAATLNQIAVDMRRERSQALRKSAAEKAPQVTLITSLFLVPAALLFVVVGLVIGAEIDFAEIFRSFQ
ncbi:type II secretion system F family protein [Naumannella halotolerans]|uniref:Tight adherence protein C n=1 Tax=Naumannella halotolerans TaxID=993414 RepID=A0A4R7J2A2_9ACTN|nr:type II secretion system F family protein [Naumannella halotolerans]TDT31280.1 tight adherence protein C [Naumannella halotolerans]